MLEPIAEPLHEVVWGIIEIRISLFSLLAVFWLNLVLLEIYTYYGLVNESRMPTFVRLEQHCVFFKASKELAWFGLTI